jgi:protein tyrosine/serine phosphatase
MSTSTDATASPAGSPFMSVSGVVNFRDLGGYPCLTPLTPALNGSPVTTQEASGLSYIRPGLLFRSAQPSQITESGIEVLTHKLNIGAIFDFRSQTEIQLVTTRYPDSLLEIPGTSRYAVPVFRHGDFSPVSLAEKYGAPSNASPTEAKQGSFVQAYEDIARNAAENGSFRVIIDHMLQNPDLPILFHCTVGKDRTGVFAALLLKLCGVSDELVIQDYALTTQGLGAWREHLIQRLLQRDDAATREDAEFIIASRPETMKSFLEDVMQAKFRGARNYFTQLCGMTEAEVNKLLSIVVVHNKD